MDEQNLDALITHLTKMMTYMKASNQGKSIENEASPRNTSSLQIMESFFTPQADSGEWEGRNKQGWDASRVYG